MNDPISKQTLQAFLFDNGIESSAPDALYALPSVEWIQNAFASALYLEQQRDGLLRYVDGKWNCNKFSRHAADFAARCYLATPEASEGTALAFGAVDFEKPDGNGHSINLAVSRHPDLSLWLVWFEPQTRSIVPPPSRKENSSCFADF